jgi:hypothetical protein
MKYASLLLAVGCLVTAAAQQWQVELVDTSRRPTDIFVRRDSDRTYVAYATSEGSIRIATKDTIWHYETLDTVLVRPDHGFHFALGPNRRMAVSGVDDSLRPVVFEKKDSGWVKIWSHDALYYYSPVARAVYGSDTAPSVLYCVNSYTSADFVVETRQDSVWQVDSAVHFGPPSNYSCELIMLDADCNPEAGPCCLVFWSYMFPLGAVPPSVYVDKIYLAGGRWYVAGWGGFQAVVDGYDIVAYGSDSAHVAVYHDGCTSLDQDPVRPGGARDAAVQVDSAGRGLMAFVTTDSVLQFAFKTGFWHFCEVPGITTATCCDLALDAYGQPMIAFEDSAGLSLARGIDVVGVEENRTPQAPSRRREPTILSGTSGVRRLASSVVFDAMGRRVAIPRSGVYFVRQASGVMRDASSVTKVVIQR